jgi:ABC-2 type transport system ATP-binding protein
MENTAIRALGIRKSFGSITALEDVSFTVGKGEFFGFLGPNGAGKTTTINILIGLARPECGTVEIAGIDCSRNVKAAQHLIGVVPDQSNLYPELTGYENLCFCGALYGMAKKAREDRASSLLREFGLTEAGGRKFAGYSRGMKRKLTIAAGMVHSPEILFLDEPTTGIDVASARHIRNLLSELHKAGTTVFLTTHYIEEAERLCDRIAFIVKGRIVRQDTVEHLLAPVKGKHVLRLSLRGFNPDLLSEVSGRFPGFSFRLSDNGGVLVESGAPFPIAPLVLFLEERNTAVLEAVQIRPSLEEVFVSVTGIGGESMK